MFTGLQRFALAQQLAFLVATGAYILHVMSLLPVEPSLLPDSESYLGFDNYRPHGYPLFLALHKAVAGDLSYLPQVQALLFHASVALLCLAVAIRIGMPPLAFAIFALVVWTLPGAEFHSVMSDAFYASCICLGAAALIFFVESRRLILLIMASAALGAAAATRTLGLVVLIALALCCVAMLLAWRPAWRRLASAAVLPASIALAIAASSNLWHNGTFEIGSWGGISLLGKGLILAEPLPPDDPLSSLNWVAEETGFADDAVATVADLHLKMLVVRQYAEYLRFFLMWDQFQSRWSEWQASDGKGMGLLGGELAKAYIRQDMPGYARLVVLDYASQWLIPGQITPSEHDRLSFRLEQVGELPYLTTFAQTELAQIDYYRIVPSPSPPSRVWTSRVLSVGLLVLSSIALLASIVAPRVLVANIDSLFLCLVIHGSYAATALAESAYIRYLFPTWPVLVGGFFLILLRFGPSWVAWAIAAKQSAGPN